MALLITLLTIAATLLTFATSLPQPRTLSPRQPLYSNTTAMNTTVTWYQPFGSDSSCGFPVANGTLHTDVCMTIHTASLGVYRLPHRDCMVQIWNDIADCSGDGGWSQTTVPMGNGSKCLDVGVLDGGKWQRKSLKWSCF